MTIDEIPVKADKIDIIDKIHLLSAEEFNAVVSMVRLLRDEVLSQGGTSYRVYLKNNLPSLSIAAQSGRPATIDFTFVSQSRDSIEDPYVNTGEYGLCTIMIQNDKYPEYTPINAPTTITSGVSIRQDVSEYLTAGLNYVRIQVVGNLTNIQTEPLTYAINLTSMGVSAPNFQWWRKQESDFTIPMLISGNNAKDLYIIVTGEDYTESYKIDVGSNPWLDNAFTNYKIKHPGKSGVYTIEYYLGNKEGTLFTQSTYLEVICVLPNDPGKYIAINNIIDKATNWIENRMFDYAIYDGNRYASYLEFSVMNDVTEVYSSVEDEITTDEKHTFVYSMEIETNELSDFEVIVNLKNEDNSILESIEIPVDNSLSFGATPGAVFYMNPRTRSNNQANYLKVTNTIDGSEYDVTWKGMNWGNDGWTIDEEGNRILRMLGGSSAVIDYKPFYVRTGYEQDIARTGKTIEIDFLVKNITDYNKAVSDMSKQQTIAGQETFIGLKIMPEQVIMLSTVTKGLSYDQQGNVKSDNQQQIHICEDRRTRLTLTIVPNAYGNPEFNLCVIYIDGVKNREFVYPTNDIFGHDSPITIGSDYADIDVYGIRVYNQGLSSGAVLLNYINWLSTSDEKNKAADRADVFAEDGSTVSFEKVVNLTNEADTSKFNCFVIDSDVPSIDNKSDNIVCTLEVFFAEHPDWNFVTKNAPVGGQGTSSKYYRKWNLRWKLSKNSETTYADGRPSDTGKQLKFTNDPTKPVLSSRLTAKKNFASSMHSHKMGSVAAFNDLYHQVGLTNLVDSRIAVYQYPFIGFQKVINEEGKTVYNFIGLYTMGPDKGDDFCFGYDTDTYPNLLSIEGSDNDPLFALFRVPWNPNNPYMKYNPGENEEAYQYNGENSWDYDAGDPASDEVEKVADVEALYKLQWMPAYNFAYSCSDRIKPFEGTAEELNANKDTYKNEPYEFWVTGGDVYYWEKAEQMYIPSDVGNGTINLYNQLVDKGYGLTSSDVEGKTAEELNELFKKARIQKFRQEVENYFDLYDAIFHRNWVEFNAATDNRAKNTYPYIFDVLDTTTKEGNKWRWRQDDMDTIWPITNQGQSRKSYSVETHDSYDNGGPVWNGATSVFWNLVDAAFPEEINQEMVKFMKAMETLGGLTSESTYYDRIYAFFDKYYFKQALEYFSMSLYNADAKWTYEDSKWAYMNGKYQNDTDPITQSLGDHYSAERRWLRKRIIYMMSKYSYGLFSASGDDHISVRSAGKGAELVFDLVPAIDLYPAISTGTSIKRGERTKAGEVRTMSFISEAADQQYKIHGAHYMLDIGDWFNKLTGGEMAVTGRMIRELRIGNEDASKVKISINKLNIQKCDSLQKLDVRNVTTMSSELDLSSCTHLREVYAKGTGLSQIILPNGGGLQYIQFGDFTEYLTLRNFPLLNADGVDISGCIDDIIHFNIQQCPNLNPLDLLMDVMEALEVQGDDHKLKYIRATGFDVTYDTSEVLDKMALLLDGTYFGLDSDGNSGTNPIPVLQGTINVNSYAYEDSIQALEEAYGKENLKINALGYAVRFLDPVMFELLCTTQFYDPLRESGKQTYYVDENQDGYITMEEINNTTSFRIHRQDGFPTKFRTTTAANAKRFNELRFFKNVGFNYDQYGATFCGIYNFDEVTLPKGLSNAIIHDRAFLECGITKILVPEGFTEIRPYAFQNAMLKYIDLPSTLVKFGTDPFRFCTETFITCRATTPPTLGTWSGIGIEAIYVPDESVEVYKTATTWSQNADKILPLSSKPDYNLCCLWIITRNGMVVTANFGTDYPYEKGVKWSIEEGGEYATIDDNGLIMPKPGVWCKDIVVRGTSKLDASVTATTKCLVYDGTLLHDYRRNSHHNGMALDSNTGETKIYNLNGSNVFDYINIRGGAKIRGQRHMTSGLCEYYIAFYDKDYTFIQLWSFRYYSKWSEFTIPENAVYARMEFKLHLGTANINSIGVWYTDTDEYIFKTANFSRDV